MEKIQLKNIIKFILFVVMIYFFVILGTKDYTTKISDNVRFSNDYKDITKDNIYKYVGEHEVLDLLNNKSGILFFGFPGNIWSHYYADYLNEVAIFNGIKEIYYYDFKKDRSLNNVTYNRIVEYLKDYLRVDDAGNTDIVAPTIVMVRNGNVIYFDDDVAFLKGNQLPEVYFNEATKKSVKERFAIGIKEYLKEE